ncbi:uncharacterized protein DS421_12g374850 [Arachis hypogaea]|nr:uncharacterized protein DS421_12g374850 [Arachis hypogaea]
MRIRAEKGEDAAEERSLTPLPGLCHRRHAVTPSPPPKALALPLLLQSASSVACAKGERGLENKERSHVRLVPRDRGLFSRHRCCHSHCCGFNKKGDAVEVPLIWPYSYDY